MYVDWRFPLATVLHGVGTGLVGIFVAALISNVQEIGYGSHEGGFLEMAKNAEPWRRMLAVVVGGLIGAFSWYWLRSRETTFVQVETSIARGTKMPVGVTLFNAIIQDTVVALGGSFGREAAPREIAAMWGGILADELHVSREQRRVLVACGTGAGLAAVYSVPISGVLYTIEHVLDWEMSGTVVTAAIVTSILATLISSFSGFIETDGLYPMAKYSYEWPSLWRLLWSALIGPVAGVAAHGFRKLLVACQTFRPQGRFPISFEEAEPGRHIRLYCEEDGHKVRRKKLILSKDSNYITVRLDNGLGKDELDEVDWANADPRGRRDWTILVAMPAAFTFLALLSYEYPFLLGNGRAMAQVAIHKRKDLGFLVTTGFLKAFVTAAAIGSGAAGGTLTPSVAIGAMLGAVVSKAWEYVLSHFGHEPQDLVPGEPKGIIAAAAFLAAMMNAPATSVALLMEFAAQGIRRRDLAALFYGDTSGVLNSKMMVGMLLPMSIAVTGATLTHKWLQPTKKKLKPTFTVRDYAAAKDLDIQGDSREVKLTNLTKDACLKCFQTGLLANACLTVGVAALLIRNDSAVPDYETVTTISAVGVPLAGVVGIAMYMQNMESSSVDDALLLDCASNYNFARSMAEHSVSRGLAVLCGVFGASIPLFPWSLELWDTQGKGLLALAASIVCAIVGNACGATIDAMHPQLGQIRNRRANTGQRRVAVGMHTLVTAMAVAASGIIGRVGGHYRH